MKTYLIEVEWADYTFTGTFTGESLEDLKMRQEIIEWINSRADGAVSDVISNEDREDAPDIINVQAYEIVEQIDLTKIILEVWDLNKKLEDEEAEEKRKDEEAEELREFQRLSKKFTTTNGGIAVPREKRLSGFNT